MMNKGKAGQAGMKNSPYGDISSFIHKDDIDRYAYVWKIEFEAEDFKPPSAWMIMDAFGNRLYFKARERKKAQQLLESFFGGAKYVLISDKTMRGL